MHDELSSQPMTRRRGRLAAWLGVAAVVSISLAVRLVHRGPYYPGWDLLGAAHGLHTVSTHRGWDALAELWTGNRTWGTPFPFYSALGALLPGALAAAVPWDQWSHVVSFASFLVTLALIARAASLPLGDAWIVPVAWSASPTLLTLSICGYPWATAFLPHAIALWVVLDERLHRRPLVSLLLALLAVEVAWHAYEPGKTVGLVFVAGALAAPGAPSVARLVWLAAGLGELALVFLYPSGNVAPYVTEAVWSPHVLLDGLRIVATMTFVDQYVDLPFLVAAGILACLVPTRRRLLVAALFAAQILLVAVVAVSFPNASHVRPRRWVMVDCYAIVLVALLAREAGSGGRLARAVRAVAVGLLIVGSVWQLVNLARFVATPFPRTPEQFAFTLPYAHSQVDYMVSPAIVDWTEELIARAGRGERLLLVYNLDAYDENITNPSGVLERLYLRLGHDAFVRSVLVFGSRACRQTTCVPVRPLSDLPIVLDGLDGAAARLTGYAVASHPIDTPPYLAERAGILDAIQGRFGIVWHTPDGEKFRRFSLVERAPRHAGT
jgi:hypothetical protein